MRMMVGAAGMLALAMGMAAPGAARRAPSLTSASAEVKSWGVTLRRWSVDRAGRVEQETGNRPGADPATVQIEVRRFVLDRPQRARLDAAVGEVERVLAEPQGCDESLTDGPYGTFRWSRGLRPQEVRIDANCVRGRDARLSAAIFRADAVVSDAAKAYAPVERRPAERPR